MTPKKPKISPELTRLDQLLEMMCKRMEHHQLGELEWQKGGETLRLRARGVFAGGMAEMSAGMISPPQPVMHSRGEPPAASPPSGSPGNASTGLKANQKQVLSPFVGTFYRSPSPGAENYVREGQVVKPGDTLCIIEAMKLMNEIEAEFPCKIVSIIMENGQPVEYGEPLFVVET